MARTKQTAYVGNPHADRRHYSEGGYRLVKPRTDVDKHGRRLDMGGIRKQVHTAVRIVNIGCIAKYCNDNVHETKLYERIMKQQDASEENSQSTDEDDTESTSENDA